MKPNRKKLSLAIAGLCLLYLFIRHVFESDVERIRDLLTAVAELAQTGATAHPLERAQEVHELGKYFAEELNFTFELDGEERQFARTRQELEQKALAAKSSFRSLEISMGMPVIVVSGAAATATMQVHVLGSLAGAEGQFYEHHQVNVTLRQTNSTWKIWKISTKNLRSKTS